jgi:hypothetical protein
MESKLGSIWRQDGFTGLRIEIERHQTDKEVAAVDGNGRA